MIKHLGINVYFWKMSKNAPLHPSNLKILSHKSHIKGEFTPFKKMKLLILCIKRLIADNHLINRDKNKIKNKIIAQHY